MFMRKKSCIKLLVFAAIGLTLSACCPNNLAAEDSKIVREIIHVPLKQEYPVFFTNTVVKVVEKPIYIDKNTDKPYPSNIGDFIPNGKQDFTALHFMVFLILVIVSILLFLFLVVFIKTLAAILNRIKVVFSKIAQCISEDDKLAEIPSDFSDDSDCEKPTKKAAGKIVSKKKAAK